MVTEINEMKIEINTNTQISIALSLRTHWAIGVLILTWNQYTLFVHKRDISINTK